MLASFTRNHLPVNIPETLEEDPSSRFKSLDAAALSYYRNQGYVILSGVLDQTTCTQLRANWESEVKPFSGKIYRQATAKLEANAFTPEGWVINPVLNLQSLDPKCFPKLRTNTEQLIFNNRAIMNGIATILEDKPKIVQSMYFEGNSSTWEHQDTYYLDSEHAGSMCAGWIALEDIQAGAGRFFICPTSHQVTIAHQDSAINVVDHHQEYIDMVVETIKTHRLSIAAPCLKAGDMLIWNSRTIHGSLQTSPGNTSSRSSITFHAIPASHNFLALQFQKRLLNCQDLGHVLIHRPKDQARRRQKLLQLAEARAPRLFHFAKGTLLKTLLRLSNG
ncbi:phytanoyl-CoA dioxygenase family protein [Synechococcus sp. CS-1325]|uniref:phytanoyl-CoA dioxygenase family protein n=1 Tax=Synechococcus sp. CS-1325 TaxID=2847979 RepID=UPI00223B4E10|nr:phytanoyl-CoA dioxygenase family protein [Synechococcus sp. CS-1325]MCT0198188.1 phytanoyl-CoA dioxygenase family protein [Synechococcus sp. CS-1325]